VQLYRYFVSLSAITFCVASQRVFIVVFVVVVYFVIDSVRKLFDTPQYVSVYGCDKPCGTRNVGWKYRNIEKNCQIFKAVKENGTWHLNTLMMMTEMDIETSVYYVHLTRLIVREDYIKTTRLLCSALTQMTRAGSGTKTHRIQFHNISHIVVSWVQSFWACNITKQADMLFLQRRYEIWGCPLPQ
jgi:hypothetical protein